MYNIDDKLLELARISFDKSQEAVIQRRRAVFEKHLQRQKRMDARQRRYGIDQEFLNKMYDI